MSQLRSVIHNIQNREKFLEFFSRLLLKCQIEKKNLHKNIWECQLDGIILWWNEELVWSRSGKLWHLLLLERKAINKKNKANDKNVGTVHFCKKKNKLSFY